LEELFVAFFVEGCAVELVGVQLILNKYQPVALHISKHTLEQYQKRSKVTKMKQAHRILTSGNIVPMA